MPDPRPCAVCGQAIVWYECALGGLVALDPEPEAAGRYAIVSDVACLIELLGEKVSSMLEGPRYHDHVRTCQPERKKYGQGKMP